MQWKNPGLPLLWNLREFLQQGRRWPLCFGIVKALSKWILEESRAINGAYCAEELRRLRQEIVKKRRGQLVRGVLLLQDNVTAHTSKVAMAVATKYSFEVLPHSPYSQTLAPSDFYLFQNLKTNLRCKNFGNNECVIDAVGEYLGGQEEGFCFKGISKLVQCWRTCIEAKGDCI